MCAFVSNVNAAGSQSTVSSTPAVTPSSNFNPTGFPIVKDKITLTAFAGTNILQKNYDQLWAITEYEKNSNIHVEWTIGPTTNFAESRNLLMSTGDYPDMFYRCSFPINDIFNYGSKGIFIPLNDLINQYGVGIKDMMNKVPDLAKSMYMPDGKIYSLPCKYHNDMSTSNYYWINKKWLDNLGLKIPTNLNEFETVLTAFKNEDANRNGDPNDEIPYSDRNSGNSIFQAFASAFGMGALGMPGRNNYYDIGDDGKLYFTPYSDNFKQMITWLAGLYSKGLLDPEMFTATQAAFNAKAVQGIVGAFFFNNVSDMLGNVYQPDYVSCPPLSGNYGPPVHNYITASHDLGAFEISNRNKYPAETLRWVDYFYTYEGALMTSLGQEGVTYIKLPDGSYQYTDLITHNPDGLALAQAIGQYAITFTGGANPVYCPDEFENTRLSAPTFAAWETVKPYLKIVAVPQLSFTLDELNELTPISSDLISYLNEARVQFVTGRRPLSQWDAFVQGAKNMGADRYLSLYQASFNRYMEK